MNCDGWGGGGMWLIVRGGVGGEKWDCIRWFEQGQWGV